MILKNKIASLFLFNSLHKTGILEMIYLKVLVFQLLNYLFGIILRFLLLLLNF